MSKQQRINKVIETLKEQAKSDKESRLDLQLFRYGLRLSISDWKRIRDPDYWKQYYLLSKEPLQQKTFIIQSIKKYLNGIPKQRRTQINH